MGREPELTGTETVALLAEGVDRNCAIAPYQAATFVSPSSRRAWIEIAQHRPQHRPAVVALLAEGVDRNLLWGAHS